MLVASFWTSHKEAKRGHKDCLYTNPSDTRPDRRIFQQVQTYGSLRFKGIVSDHRSTVLAVTYIGFGIYIPTNLGLCKPYLFQIVFQHICHEMSLNVTMLNWNVFGVSWHMVIFGNILWHLMIFCDKSMLFIMICHDISWIVMTCHQPIQRGWYYRV